MYCLTLYFDRKAFMIYFFSMSENSSPLNSGIYFFMPLFSLNSSTVFKNNSYIYDLLFWTLFYDLLVSKFYPMFFWFVVLRFDNFANIVGRLIEVSERSVMEFSCSESFYSKSFCTWLFSSGILDWYSLDFEFEVMLSFFIT